MDLAYRSFVPVEDLKLGECTVHRAHDEHGRWWNLWMYVPRDDRPGEPIDLVVAVAPNGQYAEQGPGGRRTWGLNLSSPGVWQVSPSIDVLSDGDARRITAGGQRTEASIWHQTPRVVSVPDGEAWQTAAP